MADARRNVQPFQRPRNLVQITRGSVDVIRGIGLAKFNRTSHGRVAMDQPQSPFGSRSLDRESGPGACICHPHSRNEVIRPGHLRIKIRRRSYIAAMKPGDETGCETVKQ
jgi:hypothetical protein